MKEEETPDQAKAKKTAPPEKKAEEPRPRPSYVFKIVPADPKNSLDFEDVADK